VPTRHHHVETFVQNMTEADVSAQLAHVSPAACFHGGMCAGRCIIARMNGESDKPVGDTDRRREIRLKQFAQYREEDRHEWSLLVTRVTSLVTSQAFLVAAIGLLYKKDPPSRIEHLVLVAWLALLIDAFVAVAIVIGCTVLRAWHRHGRALILEDNGNEGKRIDPPADNFLQGLYLRRAQPDWRHMLSVDLPLIGVPVLVGTGWGGFIWMNSGCPVRYFLVGASSSWLIALALLWTLAGRGLASRENEFRSSAKLN
jgi:hypothetical protein